MTAPRPKGHWPRGKRRNNPGIPDRALGVLLARARRAIEESPSTAEPTIRRAAAACGVSDRTLRRWLAGVHTPGEIHVIRLQGYLHHHGSQRRK